MKYSDTTLIVGDRKFECHKFMLAKKSDVFDAMFSHNFAEKNTGQTCHFTYCFHAPGDDNIDYFFNLKITIETCHPVSKYAYSISDHLLVLYLKG
jgi:hypothetical protein